MFLVESSTQSKYSLVDQNSKNLSLFTSDSDFSYSSIEEFQMIKSNENSNTSTKNDSCLISKRTLTDEADTLAITNTPTSNCSKPRHVLCEMKSITLESFREGCYSKPATLGSPALISNHLTHELCLSVCQELKTITAVIHINKCYCLNTPTSKLLNTTVNRLKYEQKKCGDPCPGMLDK